MATTTNLDTLVINYLTQAQYDALSTKNANEIYLTPDASITEVIAGTGLTGGGTFGSLTINHSNLVTAQNTQAVYPIKIDAQGHISAYGNAISIPTKLSDLTNDGGFVTSDENVKQTPSTTDAIYELLFSGSADNTLHIEGARKSSGLRYNPSKNTLVNSGEMRANRGVFNELVATSLSASSATITDLTTQNATVVGLLDVKGQLHSNSWTNANIANIGGSFYITPTIEPTDSQAKITITRNSATSWTVTLSGTFATNTIKTGTSSSGVAWPANSLILITGNITVNNIEYPLGTLRGTLNSSVTATASGTSKTVTLTGVTDGQGNTTPAILQKLYELNGNANISNATFTSGKISLYQIGSYPVGIQMTAMGTNANSMIEIYGGVSTQPNVRIGHLEGIPEFNHKLTTDTSVNNNKKYYTYSGGNFTVVNNPSGNPQTNGWYEADEPKGWGIYTDNGYFTGVIVATAGKIGQGANAWMIGNDENTGKATIYTGIRGAADSASMSTGIGTEDIGSSGILNATNDGCWAFTAGASFGVTTKGKLYANQAHIKGSVDATSFVVKNSQGIPIVNLSASGLQFGTEQAGITYNPTSDELDIKATTVYFGPLSADALIDEVRGGLYYQYTTDGTTYDVWYADDEDKYYYINSSGQTQEVNKANLDVDSDENLITVRRDGLSSQLSQNRDDLQTYADRLKTEEDYSTELNNRLSANESWINNTGNNTANSWNTFQDSEYITLSDYFTNAFNTAYNNRIKGILVDTTVPFIKVFAPNEQNQTSTTNQSAVVVYSDKILIKGQNNLALLDEERFAVNSIVSTNIMPAHIVFNEAAATLNITYSFAIKGRSNHHMSIVKVASNT